MGSCGPNQIKFLIGTNTGLRLISITKKGEVSTNKVLIPRPVYGITFFGDLVVATQSTKTMKQSGAKVFLLDKSTLLRTGEDFLFGSCDIHQAQYWKGEVWICDSFRDAIMRYVPGKYRQEFQPLPLPTNEPSRIGGMWKDNYHFNTLFPHGDELLTVSHSHRATRGQKSQIFCISPTVRADRLLGVQTHNLYIDDENHYTYCDSGKRNFVMRNIALALPGYSRGLAIREDGTCLVGCTKFAKERRARSYGDGRIFFISPDHTIVKEIMIEKAAIYEIRLLEEPDLAHPIIEE